MSITYNGLVSQLANLTVITSNTLVNGDANFPTGAVTGAIDYAEGRLYRDLDLPAARVLDNSVLLSTAGSNSVFVSTLMGEILVFEQVTLYNGPIRIPLVPTSMAFISAAYPTTVLSSDTGQPQFFARLDNKQLFFGPTPDKPYTLEIIGTIRPNPLSAANSSTWLTQNLPELMVAGCMVFMAGYMRDTTQEPYWEAQYQTLMKSANVDSLRMKFQSVAWSDQIPSPIATPPRV